jgi:RNA:NAD 2'-phosphotransferase (TPT1/KptA family)
MSRSQPNKPDNVRLSKTIAHALRHDPTLYGLELDEQGCPTGETNKLINAY